MKPLLTKWSSILVFGLLTLLTSGLLAQNATIRGHLTDADTRQPLVSASVLVVGSTIGAASDADGNYVISNVPPGSYTLRATYLGYTPQEQPITPSADATLTVDFALRQTVLQFGEVIVEVNRARERETPVAFTTVNKERLEQRMHGQDAPLLLRGTPGLYAYGADGTGSTGEGQLRIRGFSQNYIQVLINGVPTNDPESNAVYWSNWGSVSANAASVQVQRGAGSSLYGAGSFGGSFNIITSDALPKPYYGANISIGSPMNTFYGINLNTGLMENNTAFTLNVTRKITEGSRLGARYTGVNYYLSGAWYFQENQSIKLVLHGAPQEHGYSFSNDISFFKRKGFEANSAPWMMKSIIDQLPANATSGAPKYALTDGVRELVDNEEFTTNDKTALAHNFFHKPQLELHYNYDVSPTSSFRATLFHSVGRGAGSSMNATGNVFSRSSTTNIVTDLLDGKGRIPTLAVANTYLNPAFQRTSFSLHQQTGLLTSYDFRLEDMARVTVGGEFRYWLADHPGHFTNLFGKTSVTQTYSRRNLAGALGTFTRNVYQGDLKSPGDVGSIFGWELASEPTYRSQYRNYKGETPQYTIYAQANWTLVENLNILTSLQYVWYNYKLTENMPSENGYGREISAATATSLGLTSTANEGKHANGKFYMINSAGTTWYEFNLVKESRSRGFLQPKVGANYNVSENINVFANFSHVERFIDLGVYYNQGNLNRDVEDEKSNQFEVGAGWTSRNLQAKLNLYDMLWDNKSTRIQDVSKAGFPGYDRNGFREELIGSSQHLGIEFEFSGKAEVIPIVNEIPIVKDLEFRGSFTLMDNKWTKVLDQVKTDPLNLGTLQEDRNLNGFLDPGEDQNANGTLQENRRVFNSGALDKNGATNRLYFVELEETYVASLAQRMASFGLTYRWDKYFVALDANHFGKHIALDGGSYMAVDGQFSSTNPNLFVPVFSDHLPSTVVYDLQAGGRYDFMGFRGNFSFQILNLFDNKHLAASDRFGVIPGLLRSWRFSLSTGM